MDTLIFLSVLLTMVVVVSSNRNYHFTDVFVPDDCTVIASPTDHILIEYEIRFQNGSFGPSTKAPNQLYHIVVENVIDGGPIHAAVKGMCNNSTRSLQDFAYVMLYFVKI
jgi:hypothetical protein